MRVGIADLRSKPVAKPDIGANYWRGELVRLRPLALDDVEAWLAEDTDSEAIRALNDASVG